MSLQIKRFYTLEEYFELAKNSNEKYEYWNGQVFCMSGGSKEHVFITDNVLSLLKASLRGSTCRAMGSDMQIRVPLAPPFRYADVTVACSPEFEKVSGLDLLINPLILIEVLSTSTENFDRGGKFVLYQSIPSFREYILISQTEASITQFIKQDDNFWQPNFIIGLDSNLTFSSINCTISFRDIYDGVDFQTTR
jgi:Uma2 family endonuclease